MNVLVFFSVNNSQPGSKMVASAKSAVPTVADQAAAMQLGQCAKNLATCLAELRTATQKVSFHNSIRDSRIHLTEVVCCKALLFDLLQRYTAQHMS